MLAIAVPFMFWPSVLSGIWLGLGRMAGLAWLTVGTPALAVLGVGVAWSLGRLEGLSVILTAWVAARIFVGLAGLLAAAQLGWLRHPNAGELALHWRFVVLIGLTNLAGLLNYKVDIFLVERFLGLSATGIYSVAVMSAELLWLASSSVTTAAYARIGNPDPQASTHVTLRTVHASVVLLLALSPLLWLAVWWIVPLVLGPAYAAVPSVLAVLLPGVVLYGAASALSAWFTNHAGRPWIVAALAGGSVLVNVLVSLLTIPWLGATGAALATTVSYSLTVATAAWLFLQSSGTPLAKLVKPDWRSLWPWPMPQRRID
jgi:O-antigen/teichoic acid export membrane protein